jgi:activator of HSP90 ATPase
MMNQEIGKTKDVGFQTGARKIFPVSLNTAWRYILSPEGINHWLGALNNYNLEPQKEYISFEGITAKIRVFKPMSHLRMSWTTLDWNNKSTLQIRCIASGENTVISFHQENLSDLQQRETMKLHWVKTLEKISI